MNYTKLDLFEKVYFKMPEVTRGLMNHNYPYKIERIIDILKNEYLEIQNEFLLNDIETFVLSSLVIIYIENTIIKREFIVMDDITQLNWITNFELIKLSSIFIDLERKGFIKISDLDFVCMKTFDRVTRTFSDYFNIPHKQSFIEIFNKKFELSNEFLIKLTDYN